MPKHVPEARPISALRLTVEASMDRKLTATWATEISMTPKTLMAIAATAPQLASSPRKSSPNRAAWAGSVRE
jgi:hypothetical protein